MKHEVAKKLLLWVNKTSPEHFKLYVEERLSVLRDALEIAKSFEEVSRLQGQIKEVKRLLTVKDEVIKDSTKEEM